jgi:hypothetical protein
VTTRQQFRETVLRPLLPDAAAFSDEQLNAWIDQAILAYTGYLPNVLSGVMNLTPGQQDYDLSAFAGPAGVFDILTVELNGEYLPRLSRSDPRFSQGRFWDLVGPAQFCLSWAPQQVEPLRVTYSGVHWVPESDASQLSIPDGHLEAIKLYVLWMAVKKLEIEHALHPDEAGLLPPALAASSAAAEHLFREKMHEIVSSAGLSQVTGPWKMDARDRIY